MGSYIKALVGTGIGVALLVLSPRIGEYLFLKFQEMGGINIPYISASLSNSLIHVFFVFVVILIGLEIVLHAWR